MEVKLILLICLCALWYTIRSSRRFRERWPNPHHTTNRFGGHKF